MSNTVVCRRIIAASLAALMAGAAYSEEKRQPAVVTQPLSQTIYKGVVGTLLEEVPIEPEKRVELQRGSAVIGNTLSGRSLAVLLGVSNPLLMAAGLAWGFYAASRITPAPARALCADTPVVDDDLPASASPHGALASLP